jgi:hypothetical protein
MDCTSLVAFFYIIAVQDGYVKVFIFLGDPPSGLAKFRKREYNGALSPKRKKGRIHEP